MLSRVLREASMAMESPNSKDNFQTASWSKYQGSAVGSLRHLGGALGLVIGQGEPHYPDVRSDRIADWEE